MEATEVTPVILPTSPPRMDGQAVRHLRHYELLRRQEALDLTPSSTPSCLKTELIVKYLHIILQGRTRGCIQVIMNDEILKQLKQKNSTRRIPEKTIEITRYPVKLREIHHSTSAEVNPWLGLSPRRRRRIRT